MLYYTNFSCLLYLKNNAKSEYLFSTTIPFDCSFYTIAKQSSSSDLMICLALICSICNRIGGFVVSKCSKLILVHTSLQYSIFQDTFYCFPGEYRKSFCLKAATSVRKTRTSGGGRSTCPSGTPRSAAQRDRARPLHRTSRASSSLSRNCSTRASTRTRCSPGPQSKSCVRRMSRVCLREARSTFSPHAASTSSAPSPNSLSSASGATVSSYSSSHVSGRPLSSAIPTRSLVRI